MAVLAALAAARSFGLELPRQSRLRQLHSFESADKGRFMSAKAESPAEEDRRLFEEVGLCRSPEWEQEMRTGRGSQAERDTRSLWLVQAEKTFVPAFQGHTPILGAPAFLERDAAVRHAARISEKFR